MVLYKTASCALRDFVTLSDVVGERPNHLRVLHGAPEVGPVTRVRDVMRHSPGATFSYTSS